MTYQSFNVDSTPIQLLELGPFCDTSSRRSSTSPSLMHSQNLGPTAFESEAQSPTSSDSLLHSTSINSSFNRLRSNFSELSQDPVLLNPNLYLYSPSNRKKLKNLLTQKPLAIPHWLWEADDQTDDCFDCRKDFNIFNRRHHCRRCGIIYCDNCSSSKKLLSESITDGLTSGFSSEEDFSSSNHSPKRCVWTKRVNLVPSRVCHTCSDILEINQTVSKYSNLTTSCGVFLEIKPEGLMISNFNDLALQSLDEKSSEAMLDCPACYIQLDSIGSDEEQAMHVAHCLKRGPSIRNADLGSTFSFSLPGGGKALYIPYKLTEKDSIVDQECQICLDVFRSGDEAARLSCFCCYHLLCAKDWFQRCPTCPTHGV